MHYMYFGTRERMGWIPCPAIDANLSKIGWSNTGRYLNGGAYVRRSATAGKAYQFSWNLMASHELSKMTAYADGLYGQGPFYFIEPFAYANVLPQYWAAPRLAALDAPPLITDKRPSLATTATNGFAYPTKSAVYTLEAGDTFATLWVPIPDGYTLHIGVHGSATSTAAVKVQPDGGSVTSLTPLTVTTSTLTNHSIAGPTGVTFTLGGVGTLTLAGMIAALVPTGEAAPLGDFVPGLGHSGCDFEQWPTENGYSAALDKKGASASMVEVGAWL